MKFGFCPIEGGPTWKGVVEQCRLAEELGFASTWVNDHQATEGENYWPAPLIRLTGIAAGTETLELVTSVLILPLYHPLHVAQGTAMLDLISDGRVTLGVGLGYVEKEFAAFDVPMDERAGRMIEGLKFIDQFLSADGPISFDSPFVSVDHWEPLPQTVQKPRPPLWIGGWGDMQIERSVKFSDAWVPGVVADHEDVRIRKEKQREFVEQAGQDWGAIEHPIMRETVIAETHDEAIELGKKYLHRTYLDEYGGEFSHPFLKGTDVSDFEDLADDRFLVGSPEEIIEQIEGLQERFAVDHIGCRFHHSGMPHDVNKRQVELFGEEVIPAFS